MSKIINENVDNSRSKENFPMQPSFNKKINDELDYLSNTSYTSRQSNLNSNYYHEYLQIDSVKSEKNQPSPSLNHDKKSITSVVRF